MDSQVILRQVAAAAVDLVGLRDATRDDLDASIQRKSISLLSSEFKAHPVTTRNASVAQKHRRTVDIADHHIHVSVIKDIAYCEATRDTALDQRFTGLVAGIAKGAIFLIELEQLRLA